MTGERLLFVAVVFCLIMVFFVYMKETKTDSTRAALEMGFCPIVVTVPCGHELCSYEGVADCDEIKKIIRVNKNDEIRD